MILLDTNVISELMRPVMNPAVRHWVDAQPDTNLYLSVAVMSELRFGIERLEQGVRRKAIEATYADLKSLHFRDRILPIDLAVAELAAIFRAQRMAQGRPVDFADCLIAGTAAARGLSLATRNTGDFEGLGLTLINPFEARPA